MTEVSSRVCQLCNLVVSSEHEICPNCDGRLEWARPMPAPERISMSTILALLGLGLGLSLFYVGYSNASVVEIIVSEIARLIMIVIRLASQGAVTIAELALRTLQQLLNR